MTAGSLDIFITKIYFVKLDANLKLIRDYSFDLKKKQREENLLMYLDGNPMIW